MSRRTKLVVGLMLACLCIPSLALAARAKEAPAAAQPAAPAPSLEDAFKQLPTYEFGQSREGLTVIADAVRDSQSNPAERKKLVDRLTALLGTSASLDAKRFVCRQLSIVGTAESVPALSALLLDKDLSDMARYALERIADPSADAAIRAAMAKAAGKQKVGMINSLGQRRDAPSAAALTASLKDADPMVAAAAAAALGKIGGPEAAQALTAAQAAASPELKAVINDSLLLCADRLMAEGKKDAAAPLYADMYKPTQPKHLRMAALRGLIAAGGDKAVALLTEILAGTDADLQAAALRFLRETSGPDSAKTVAAMLPKVAPASQALLLDDLAARGDLSTLSAVLPLAKSQDAAVRLAAIRAMGRLGDASTLPILTPAAAGADVAERDAARAALDRLPGADVNAAMIALAQKGDPKVRAEIIRSLGARRVAAAMPVLLAAAKDADATLRTEAIKAVEVLADEKSAPALVEFIVKAKDDAERTAAEKALGTLCGRAANKDACVDPILAAMGAAEIPAKCALTRALGRTGSPKALAALRAAVKDAAPEIQDAAIRGLADWPDTSAAADLLGIAKTGAKPAHQVLALRGYVRLAGTPGVSDADRIKMYTEAMAAAKRPDEKKLVLGGLSGMKSLDALKMAAPCLDDASLQAEACVAAVAIAKALGGAGKDDSRAAMQKVIGITKDANVRKDAEGVLKSLGGAPAPAKAPKKGAKAAAATPEIRVYAAPVAEGKKGDAKKESPKAEAPKIDLSLIKKVDLSPAEALGWRLGFQAYTFRALSFAETVDIAGAMGIKYIEIYPGQRLSPDKPDAKTSHTMTDEQIAEMKKLADSKGIKIVNYGVVGLGADEASARKVFDFAKKVGLETIVTEAPESMFDLLDKLTEEYKVNIALHNHPKPSHYWDADTVLKGVQGHSKRIGSDADTGHWVRSGLVPLECLKKLEGHIISLHFKDLDQGHDVPWGTGKGDAKAMLTELYRQRFKGVFSIEYESGSGQQLVDNVNKCVEFFAATAAELSKGL